MAETFHPFPDLPKELRLQIWEQAMIEARPDRRIIVYQLRVVPFKQSISPLLLVNHESRTCARAFYNVKLDVYAIPPLSSHQIKSLDKKMHWKRIPGIKKAVDGKLHGYTDRWTRDKFHDERKDVDLSRPCPLHSEHTDDDMREYQRLREKDFQEISRKEKEYTVHLEEHWASYVEDQLGALGSESAAQVDTSGLTRGVFYISPEHDVFIEGYECGEHFFNIDDTSKIFGAQLKQRVTSHHISEILNAATRERVSTLVQVLTPEIWFPHHCVFVKDQEWDDCLTAEFAEASFDDWYNENEWTFPSVDYYFGLHTSPYDRPGFLKTLLDADGVELSSHLDKWIKTAKHSLDTSMVTFLNFKHTKSYFIRDPSTQPADWTRDLMEHWDVGQVGAVPLRYQQSSNDEPRRAANRESPASVVYGSRVGVRRTFWGSLKRFWETLTGKLMAQPK